MPAMRKQRRTAGGKPGSRATRTFGWLLLPTLILLPAVVISTFWYRPTHVRLEFETTRLALTLGDGTVREILNPSAPFSSLVIEDCRRVDFAAESLEAMGTAAVWRAPRVGSITFPCRDPEAKLTLRSSDPATTSAGALGHVLLDPRAQVILEVAPGREPAVSLEIETPQDLQIPVSPALELVADFVEPAGIAAPFPGTPLTWRARIPEAHPFLAVTSGEHGLVLIVAPAPGRAADLFAEKPDLPLTALELLEENLQGDLTSPLRGSARLSYPDFPDLPPVTIEPDKKLGLGALSQARLIHLSFDAGKATLRAGFEGIAERPASRTGDLIQDHRLTLFHTVYHNWRWAALAAAAAWLASTTWAGYEAWKKLRE
jgi:hypothetical protein